MLPFKKDKNMVDDAVFSKPKPDLIVDEDFFIESDAELDDHSMFRFIYIDRNDILEAIDKRSNFAAGGPDGFPAILLKCANMN